MTKKDKTTIADDTTDASRHISEAATLQIWVRSGGRCARCNTFLLEDAVTEVPVNLAERAHIVGWINSPGSPRGAGDLPLADRNKPGNLMLLCMPCHKMIDKPEYVGKYTVEYLREMKAEHEERIYNLSAIAPDRDTAVIRVFGAIRGSIPELARDQAREAVVQVAGRYARFPLAQNREGIELNLSRLPEPEEVGSSTYWTMGKAMIDQIAGQVSDAVHHKHIRHVSIFALARIPLLVYLGFVLDDKVPMDIYQKHRGTNEGWVWPEDDQEPVLFESKLIRAGTSVDEVCLILSLSGTIGTGELPSHLSDVPVYQIRPLGIDPNRDLFRSKRTLFEFARTYHNLLSRFETLEPKPKRIRLFLASPITAAIACGRGLMRQVQPEIVVYDRIGNQFQEAITINTNH